MGQIKLGEHARKDECRLFPGAEECTAHPAVRVGDVAESWNVALETRQVFEVGGKSEEHSVDALGMQHLVHSFPASRKVEHGRLV